MRTAFLNHLIMRIYVALIALGVLLAFAEAAATPWFNGVGGYGYGNGYSYWPCQSQAAVKKTKSKNKCRPKHGGKACARSCTKNPTGKNCRLTCFLMPNQPFCPKTPAPAPTG